MRHRQNTNITLILLDIGNMNWYLITILKLKIENNEGVEYTLSLRSK